MVQLLLQRLERCLDFAEVLDPAKIGVDCPFNVDLNTIGMAVQAAALMPLRYMRESVSGFESKFLIDFC